MVVCVLGSRCGDIVRSHPKAPKLAIANRSDSAPNAAVVNILSEGCKWGVGFVVVGIGVSGAPQFSV